MERKLTLTEQVNNLELANKALRNYANELEKKLARYEHVLQCCPRFRMEKQAEMEQAAPAYMNRAPAKRMKIITTTKKKPTSMPWPKPTKTSSSAWKTWTMTPGRRTCTMRTNGKIGKTFKNLNHNRYLYPCMEGA